jgi:hypothetical protein
MHPSHTPIYIKVYAYDSYGRPASVTEASGKTTSYSHIPNMSS